MKNRTRNIMKGIGSIFNLMPAERRSLDLSRLMPRKTPEEMVADAWSQTGYHLRKAMGQVASEEGFTENSPERNRR